MSFNNSFFSKFKVILLSLFLFSMVLIAGLLTYLLAFNNEAAENQNSLAQDSSEVQTIEIAEDQQETNLEKIDDSAASFTTTDLNLLQDLEEDLRP